MRLSVPLFAVVLIALQSTSQEPTVKNKAPSQHKQQTAAKAKPESNPCIATDGPPIQNASAPEEQQQQKQPKNGPYSINILSQPTDYWSRVYIGLTAFLAAIGFGTLVLLYIQTRAAHKAERARVDAILRVDWPRVFFEVHNFGKSAAIITGCKLTHATFSKEDTAFTQYAPQRPIHEAKIMKHVLVPAESIPDTKPNIFYFDITNFLSEEERQGEHVTLFTSSLTYEDIFEINHATQTTYRYTPSRNVPNVGSLEYLSRFTRYT